MSFSVNKVFLLGNLGADPELRFTQGGAAVLNFRVATTESYLDKNKQRQEKTDWNTVVCFGKQAESLAKLLSKGAKVHVEGRLQTRSWDDKEGNKRYSTEVNASSVILCSGHAPQGVGSMPSPTAPPGDGPPDYGAAGVDEYTY